MIFRKKKVEKPKSILGNALMGYDNIINTDLRDILKNISLKKNINTRRAETIVKQVIFKFDGIVEDLSKENFKTDYRSDKIRDLLIGLIMNIKEFFEIEIKNDFDQDKIKNGKKAFYLNIMTEKREEIRSKMKDIESDYI